ncbi:YggS family pyridoxal phosphate-dependent enzyme [uncultured Fenollaria sp.]|uniref:YggS family pyridoxal phosphate-dependent enzyme n=1 Tax=uncultured Fenollaria sp. TaxID=1686315 RepID=UPI0025EC6E92|nr:YggS family pyridoxal phosphate-dependent enzyme [uncultured Fenollaria sp.]
MSVGENLIDLLESIDKEIDLAGRKKDEVKLLAVTKTVDVERIKEIKEFGLKEIGENKVQEIEEKYDALKDDFDFHMIGSLQKNKINKLLGKIKLIHSLDSLSLIEALDKRLANNNMELDGLLQVNISKEESKSGFYKDEVEKVLEQMHEYKNLHIVGFMTMAPFTEDEAVVRNTFRGLYELKEKLAAKNFDNVDLKYLSMGMTHDYKIAIQEGSNILRIGSKIFGERNY